MLSERKSWEKREKKTHLKHIDDSSSITLITQFDSNSGLSDSFYSISENDSRNESLAFALVGIDDELFRIARHRVIQLEFRRSETLPNRVVLLKEDFAPHVGDDGSLFGGSSSDWRSGR